MSMIPPLRWHPKNKVTALKIAFVYALMGGMWILFSDRLVSTLVKDPAMLTRLQTFKGWLYIAVTTLVLYWLVRISVQSHMKAEEALQESQRTLSNLLSNLPGMAYRCRCDDQMSMEFVSDGCKALTGYSSSELMDPEKISYTRLIHPEDLISVREERRKAMLDRKPFRVVYRIKNAKGETRWVLEQGMGIVSAEGKISVLEGFVSDITERKRTEKALQKSERKFRSLFENSADAMLLLDGNVFVDCNPAAVKMMHCADKEQLLSLHPAELSPERQPDGRLSFDKANELIAEAFKKKSLRFRWVHRRADGQDFPVEVLLTVIPINDKPMIYTVWRDITERVQAEEALKESEERYRTLVESTSDAIVLVDQNRKILSFNQAFLDLFGYSRDDEVVGQPASIVHPSDESYHAFAKATYPMLHTKGPLRLEWQLMRKDGTLFPVEGSYSVIRAFDGSIKGYVAILRDITKRKKAEEDLKTYRNHLEEMVNERTRDLEAAQKALVQKEKLKTLGAITAEVAHEFRNPLVSIGGFARRLQKKFPDSQEAEIILKEAHRLELLLERIDHYLKPIHLQPRECLVNPIVTECVDLLSPELARENVHLQLELDPGLPPAYVDPEILSQVLIIVTTNAVKIMDKTRPLIIQTYRAEENIYIDFRNPVLGKKIKDPELLFLPFQESGNNIEMSRSYQLLKEMGGVLSFTQEPDYMVFSVSLRKAGAEETEEQKKGDK
jgi:PAS domain S-box-containing protein